MVLLFCRCRSFLGLIFFTTPICFLLNRLWLIKDATTSATATGFLNLGIKTSTKTLREISRNPPATIRPNKPSYLCFTGDSIYYQAAFCRAGLCGGCCTHWCWFSGKLKWMNCSLQNPSIWALGQAILPGRGPSSQDTGSQRSCHASLLPTSLQCYSIALEKSTVSLQGFQGSAVHQRPSGLTMAMSRFSLFPSTMLTGILALSGIPIPFPWNLLGIQHCWSVSATSL